MDQTTTSKVAQVTLAFWVMKICATTLGETAGDMVSMTFGVGYGLSTLMLMALFLASLFFQLRSTRFHPSLYWLVILTTSTAGTTLSDYLDRTLGLGYATGSALIAGGLALVLLTWWAREGRLAVDDIRDRRVETFYWVSILFSNTLGTALGDYLADSSGLGFLGGALLIAGAIAGVACLHRLALGNRIVLFWVAFVLTRPFGATFGDLLTKPLDKGGLAIGTIGASLILAALLVATIWYTSRPRSPAATAG